MADPTSKHGPLSWNPGKGPCTVCHADGLPCARCRLDYYCGKEHQRQDWARHKPGCGAVELRYDDDAVLGRHLVATKDIPAGTVLLRETALVVVPNYKLNGPMYCAGCCVRLYSWTHCRQCGWPVCDRSCSQRQEHRAECAAFQRASFKLSMGEIERSVWVVWYALGALKVYLAAQERPRILDLQCDFSGSHTEDGVRSAVTEARDTWRRAARWLRGVAGLDWLPEQGLVEAAARVTLNAADSISDSGPVMMSSTVAAGKERTVSALFAGASMLEHSCVPTTTNKETNENPFAGNERQERLIIASRLVRAGEHLTEDYMHDPFMTTPQRSKGLRCYGFVCRCSRCLDPSECGLYLGSTCCIKCSREGAPRYVVEASPGQWQCETCGPVEGGVSVGVEEGALDACQGARPKQEAFVEMHKWPRGRLHATHYLVLKAEHYILQSIDLMATTADKRDLASRAAICRAHLAALDALGWGLCSRRFNLLGILTQTIKLSLQRLMEPTLRRRPNLMGPAGYGVFKQFAPQSRELEALAKEMDLMVTPKEREFFRLTTGPEMERLLVLTGRGSWC